MADGTVNEVWNIINTGGVVALLFWDLWRYHKGDVISKTTHDEIMQSQEANTKLMAAEVCNGMKDAVKQGFLEAHYEINGRGE